MCDSNGASPEPAAGVPTQKSVTPMTFEQQKQKLFEFVDTVGVINMTEEECETLKKAIYRLDLMCTLSEIARKHAAQLSRAFDCVERFKSVFKDKEGLRQFIDQLETLF